MSYLLYIPGKVTESDVNQYTSHSLITSYDVLINSVSKSHQLKRGWENHCYAESVTVTMDSIDSVVVSLCHFIGKIIEGVKVQVTSQINSKEVVTEEFIFDALIRDVKIGSNSSGDFVQIIFLPIGLKYNDHIYQDNGLTGTLTAEILAPSM